MDRASSLVPPDVRNQRVQALASGESAKPGSPRRGYCSGNGSREIGAIMLSSLANRHDFISIQSHR